MYTLKSENKYFENIFNSFLNKKGWFDDYFKIISNKTTDDIQSDIFNIIFSPEYYSQNEFSELKDTINNLNNINLKNDLLNILAQYDNVFDFKDNLLLAKDYILKNIEYTNNIDFSKLNTEMILLLIYFLIEYPLNEINEYSEIIIWDNFYDFIDSWIGDYNDNIKKGTFNIWSKEFDFFDLIMFNDLNAWFEFEESWSAEEITR
jgi:hypothetical protein